MKNFIKIALSLFIACIIAIRAGKSNLGRLTLNESISPIHVRLDGVAGWLHDLGGEASNFHYYEGLDNLYAKLTVKTKAKIVLVVLDGLRVNLATAEQGFLTPLEAAHLPNLDALAQRSARRGRMIPVAPRSITPEQRAGAFWVCSGV